MRRIRIILLLMALLALLSSCSIAITTRVSAGREYDIFFDQPTPEKQAEYLRSGKSIAPICEGVFVAPRITLFTHEDYRLQFFVLSLAGNADVRMEQLCLTNAAGEVLYTLPGETALLQTESDGLYTAAIASEPFPGEKLQPGSDLTLDCILVVDGESFDLTWDFSVWQQRVPVFPT